MVGAELNAVLNDFFAWFSVSRGSGGVLKKVKK